MEIIFLIIGLVVGGFFAYFFLKSKFESKIGQFEERSNFLSENLSKKEIELDEKQVEIIELNKRLSSLQSDYSNLEKKLAEDKEELQNIQEKFTKEFENLANKIFEEKSNKFTRQNKENINLLLKPLGEKINDFSSRLNKIHDDETRERATLKEQIKQLGELNQQLSKEADSLTKALKGDSRTQGTWGEMILEKILEKSGLVKGEQFEVQQSFTSETNKRTRPDVVVYLPENKNIVIDSKVSLTAYERFINEEDEALKNKFLKEHIRSIQNHVKELSAKNYQSLYQLNTLDFVIMFVPIESALGVAFQNEHNLFYDAFEKNILIVNPSALLATLRTIESIWKQEKQNRNAKEIARQSGLLYEKFIGLVNDLIDVGKRMDASKQAYESAMNKLSDGKGNLVSKVEKLKSLGAQTQKTLPKEILNRALDDEDTKLIQ
ncbi:MAG: DNA recombination protein RmuC [Chlorobi bacterium]|nr:DNA recombination protein RmuC [Chlorobiota bacterium]